MSYVVEVSRKVWKDTWGGLRERSRGPTEAGCVWGGERLADLLRATEVLFFDALPGTRRSALSHVLSKDGAAALFESMSARGLDIIADIHTHPAGMPELSWIDEQHPIEYRVGLLALVVPGYARHRPALSGIGAHEYLGDLRWRAWPLKERRARLRIVDQQR
jgi:hypothetical protein